MDLLGTSVRDVGRLLNRHVSLVWMSAEEKKRQPGWEAIWLEVKQDLACSSAWRAIVPDPPARHSRWTKTITHTACLILGY